MTIANEATAAVPAALVNSTIQVGILTATGQAADATISPHVLALAEGAIRTMFMTKLKCAVGMLTLILMLCGALAYQAWAVDPAEVSPPASSIKKTVTGIQPEQFEKLQAMIKPKPGGFADVPWMTDLWAARKKAAAEGKPLLVWVGDGHPLGWT
jgi:hypothetical protein